YLVQGISFIIAKLRLDTSLVKALPVAFMKTLRGSAARGSMVEAIKYKRDDDFAACAACDVQGCTETTLDVLAVYIRTVAIKNTRHALPCALLSELVGVIAAIVVGYIFFG